MVMADFIQKNMDTLKSFIRAGMVAPTVLRDYQIYVFYRSLDKIPSQMDRYEFTAESMNTSCPTVRNAISKMKKKVR